MLALYSYTRSPEEHEMLQACDFRDRHVVLTLAAQYMLQINEGLLSNKFTDEYYCNLFKSIYVARLDKPFGGARSELEHYRCTLLQKIFLLKDLFMMEAGTKADNSDNSKMAMAPWTNEKYGLFTSVLTKNGHRHTERFWKNYRDEIYDEILQPINCEVIKHTYDLIYLPVNDEPIKPYPPHKEKE